MRVDVRRALLVAAAIVAAGCDAIYGPTAPSTDWSTHESTRYLLYARPGSFADQQSAALVEVLEEQYSHALTTLAIPAGGRISVFLYNAGTELDPPLPNARAGVAFPETNAVHAVAFPPLDNDLRALLAHEANHVIVANALGRAGTSFMNEGLAGALVTERYGDIGPAFMHRWVRNNRSRLPRLADLVDDSKWNSNSNEGYRSSASFIAYLLQRYGATALKQLYYAGSADFARRINEIYGRSLEALEAEWLAAI